MHSSGSGSSGWIALWSLGAWALHGLGAWALANAGALGAPATGIEALALPAWVLWGLGTGLLLLGLGLSALLKLLRSGAERAHVAEGST